MKKTKLSGNVNLLHTYCDKGKQKAGVKAIKKRKHDEKWLINMEKFFPTKRILAIRKIKETKRQKLSDQIQHGFDIMEKRKNE